MRPLNAKVMLFENSGSITLFCQFAFPI
uniref:Uncharacterized protein n=1 Tax=Arundo donax TaxID=35708 RepID=A0A0A9AAW0_ARUDO